MTLQVECIDRMYLNVYQPKLQTEKNAACFFRCHRGQPVASAALRGAVTRDFLHRVDAFVDEHGIPVVHFRKGRRKDDVAAAYRARFRGAEGILFLGKAQEKVTISRTEPRTGRDGKKDAWIVTRSTPVNQLSFYGAGEDFGPFFLKFCSHSPYNAKLCLNGPEYVKRQLAKHGSAFEALGNGIRSCADPGRLPQICDGLSAAKIDARLRQGPAKLPHPYTPADRQAGYRYPVSVLQAEFSPPQVLGRPQTGRSFFEQVIRENLDLGRPDPVQLMFGRRVRRDTPGRFRTRALTEGVIPSLHGDSKSRKVKQYHQAGQALRTATTIDDARDFGINKGRNHLPALRQVGFSANGRLRDVQRISHDCRVGEDAFRRVDEPVQVDGPRAGARRFADPVVQALVGPRRVFRRLPRGFGSRELRGPGAPLIGKAPASITAGQMTYHRRRRRRHGRIERVPKSHRYRVTASGWRAMLFCTRCDRRRLRPGRAEILPPAVACDTPLRRRFDELAEAIQKRLEEQVLAA